MSLSDLSHSPEFELPDYGPAYPEDVLSLLESEHEGLYKVVITKMLARGKYQTIATIKCQDDPARKKHPVATPEEISEYVMLCIQHEIDENDLAGIYRVQTHGPPGKGGGKTRSKHIDLTDDRSDARSVNPVSEGELIEQQNAYIGELHGQIIACIETVQGVVRPLMQENKEMMKIVSDAQRNLAEVEQLRLTHDLNMRMHQDQRESDEAEEARRMERWSELLKLAKDTGAAEELLNGLIARFVKPKDALKALAGRTKKEEVVDTEEAPASGGGKNGVRKKKKKKNGSSGSSIDEKKIYDDAMERVENNPLLMAAEALKMSIDENRQWKIVYKSLNEEQAECFDEIIGSSSDEDIKTHVNKLAEIDGLPNLLELNKHLDEKQQKFVGLLLSSIE